MADSNTASNPSDESEQQITFNVKSSSDTKYVLTLPIATTVGDIKNKLSTSEYASLPPERQRLIYSGRVLKDHDTIATCKIKDGNTVHLVRGAESNNRQNPANQGAAPTTPGAGQPASNVPSNIAAGTGAGNPLAQLTGARYAGFHGLPDMNMFGADGGMGAPPNTDQMLRLLDDPNFASQMNEAMNNPAVLDMLRNSPLIRNNPVARQIIENPAIRRMMTHPDMIRMQMQMQRSMGGMGGAGGEGSFPMPGQTDTTEGTTATVGGTNNNQTANQTANPTQQPSEQNMANPFAALFSQAPNAPGQPDTGATGQQQPPPNPFASLFGAGGQQGDSQNNPLAQMTQQMMQNPEMMQQFMQAIGGGPESGNTEGGSGATGNPYPGINPFMLGNLGNFGQQDQAPASNVPPEERYQDQLRQLNDMGFFEFERNVQALRRSGGSVEGAIEYLLNN